MAIHTCLVTYIYLVTYIVVLVFVLPNSSYVRPKLKVIGQMSCQVKYLFAALGWTFNSYLPSMFNKLHTPIFRSGTSLFSATYLLRKYAEILLSAYLQYLLPVSCDLLKPKVFKTVWHDWLGMKYDWTDGANECSSRLKCLSAYAIVFLVMTRSFNTETRTLCTSF